MMKTLRIASLVICGMVSASFAQDVHSIAEREVMRRQQGIGHGEATLIQAKAAMDVKDYVRAHDAYRAACSFLPDGTASNNGHTEALRGFCESGVKLAETRIAEGRYGEAEQVVAEILTYQYDPNCREAREIYNHLHEPGYYNKTMGPKFIAKVQDVRALPHASMVDIEARNDPLGQHAQPHPGAPPARPGPAWTSRPCG